MCTSSQLRILNGRSLGDSIGKVTSYNGTSIDDYCICSSTFLSNILNFRIEDCHPNTSDQCQITVNIFCSNILGPKQDIRNHRKLLPVIRWSPIREQKFIKKLNYDSFNNTCTKTEKLIASENADKSTSEVDDVVVAELTFKLLNGDEDGAKVRAAERASEGNAELCPDAVYRIYVKETFYFYLLHHLQQCIRLYGPPRNFWMFPYQRLNHTLSAAVSNNQYPELSAIEKVEEIRKDDLDNVAKHSVTRYFFCTHVSFNQIKFRRENRILCGLWFGKEKPNFPTFFKPFTELLWKLYTDGYVVKDENGDDQKCKAMLLQMTCDSPAKCLFQDFIQYNGDASNSFSVHLLLHIPNTVLQNGPLWCQSCFWFEDYNGELRQFFHSSQHPDSQVARAVHIVQKLPEMVKIMNPESAAAILQRKMTSDRYKVEIIKYVQRGICVVGKAEEANLADHENVFSLVKLAKPSFTGIPLKYKRALLQGEMIHSKIYQKVSQRNSFTVEYQNLTDKEYGEILFFLGLDDDYLAVVNKFTKKKCALTEDHTTGPSGGHLLTFEKQSFNNTCTKTEKLIASENADKSTSEVDDVVSDFNKLLKGAATLDNRFESKLHNKQKRRKIKNPWVDKDCVAKYRHIKALCRTLGRNPWDSSLRLNNFTEKKLQQAFHPVWKSSSCLSPDNALQWSRQLLQWSSPQLQWYCQTYQLSSLPCRREKQSLREGLPQKLRSLWQHPPPENSLWFWFTRKMVTVTIVQSAIERARDLFDLEEEVVVRTYQGAEVTRNVKLGLLPVVAELLVVVKK
ncbi:unnamed protein product [Mytilus coruscus]|uniref:Uncharacterized protein n=1 Tax=Mytilus coruscus TaxID=42192 RepID=A0A6J8C935_MYTCO|nr:unnamed protein product [Mytilus coruscus]